MQLVEGRQFEKQYAKLSKPLRDKIRERVRMLVDNSHQPLLNDHKLNAPLENYRSINITGDIRLIYRKLDEQTFFLHAVGTHHQLFGS